MTWTITATAAAEADLIDAIDWYEVRSAGLGARLLDDFRGIRDRLATNPFQFPFAYRDARRASLRRFPYVVLFRATDSEVRLIAVFHTSRDPRRWRARVRRG